MYEAVLLLLLLCIAALRWPRVKCWEAHHAELLTIFMVSPMLLMSVSSCSYCPAVNRWSLVGILSFVVPPLLAEEEVCTLVVGRVAALQVWLDTRGGGEGGSSPPTAA